MGRMRTTQVKLTTESGTDSRDEVQHTKRRDLLLVTKMM